MMSFSYTLASTCVCPLLLPKSRAHGNQPVAASCLLLPGASSKTFLSCCPTAWTRTAEHVKGSKVYWIWGKKQLLPWIPTQYLRVSAIYSLHGWKRSYSVPVSQSLACLAKSYYGIQLPSRFCLDCNWKALPSTPLLLLQSRWNRALGYHPLSHSDLNYMHSSACWLPGITRPL